MRLRRVRQARKGREERKRSIKTDDRQLKAQDKSLKISTKESRCVCSRQGIRTSKSCDKRSGVEEEEKREKNGRSTVSLRSGPHGDKSERGVGGFRELRGERTTGP